MSGLSIFQVGDLSEECVTLREKASRLESELGRERELRSGAEKLAGELQTSLTRESERAEDLKVCSTFTVEVDHLGHATALG